MVGGVIMEHKLDEADFIVRMSAKEFLMQQHELANTITELQARLTKVETAMGITHGDE